MQLMQQGCAGRHHLGSPPLLLPPLPTAVYRGGGAVQYQPD